MRKIICTLLAVLMLFSICACGTVDDTKPSDTNVLQDTENISLAETTEQTQAAQAEEEWDTFRFPFVESYCNVFPGGGRLGNGGVAVTSNDESYIASVYCGKDLGYDGDISGIFNFVLDGYIDDVNKYLLPDADETKVDVKNIGTQTVSGCDSIKYSGTIGNVDGGTYQVYGYTLFFDEMPMLFLGILRSEDQAKEDLNTMQSLIDLMVNSIHK